MAFISFAVILFVQIPLSFRYYKMIKAEPIVNAYLKKRLVLLPAVTFPWHFFSSRGFDSSMTECHNKYLGDLNDFELDNFDQMYH